MRFTRTPSVVTRPGPTFGQDAQELLLDVLGFTAEEMADLYAAGALE
jgi:hypothetical protein